MDKGSVSTLTASEEAREPRVRSSVVAIPVELARPRRLGAPAHPATPFDLRRFFAARFGIIGAGGRRQAQPRIVIVDDDRSLLGLLRVIFQEANFEVSSFLAATDALDYLQVNSTDVIVLDLEMPMMNGREFFRAARAAGITAPVLVLSAYGARSASEELGADAALDKPFDPDELVEAINQLLDRQ